MEKELLVGGRVELLTENASVSWAAFGLAKFIVDSLECLEVHDVFC